MSLHVVKKVGRYEIQPHFRPGSGEYLIGGSSKVYRARVAKRRGLPVDTPEYVCLKVWDPSELAQHNKQVWQAERARFLHEGELFRRFASPHLLRCFESGSAKLDGTTVYFHCFELCTTDLATEVQRRARFGGFLQPSEILQILKPISAALDWLHRNGVVHRDVRPENCFRRADGEYCLGDLGVALDGIGDPTLRVGTASYSAPEHNPTISGSGDASRQSDVYGLGKMTLMMLTAIKPRDIAARQITELPNKLNYYVWADEICKVLTTATRQNPAARQSSALVFWDDLRRAFAAFDIAPTLLKPRMEPILGKYRSQPVAIGGVLAIMFATLLVLAFVGVPHQLDRGCRVPVLGSHLVARSGANLRSAASANAQLICALPPGSSLIFEGDASDGWLRVYPTDPLLTKTCQQKGGYVYAENIDWVCP